MAVSINSSTTGKRLLGQESFKNYQILHPVIKQIADSWRSEVLESSRRRSIRLIDTDAETLKDQQHISEDGHFSPIRLTDQNIIREQSAYVGYIIQAKNTLHFKSTSHPTLDTSLLTKHFSNVTRYTGWEIEHLKNIDAFQTHGTSILMLEYDKSKPGDLEVEYLPHDRVFYPDDTEELQDAPVIIIHKTLTRIDAKEMLKEESGWNSEEVKSLFESNSPNSNETLSSDDSIVDIYQTLFKENGIVYECFDWDKSSDWLKAPAPKHIGRVTLTEVGEIKAVPERDYPLFIFQYRISEDLKLVNSKGRVFLDEPLQDSLTSLQSSFVTSYARSTEMYFTKGDTSPDSRAPEITDFKLKPNTYLNKAVKQFQLSPAPPELLTVIQSIRSQGMEEGGAGINFSVINRQDSRKTAKEVGAAQEESAKLSGIQVANFSLSYLKLYQTFWQVYRTRVLAEIIPVDQVLKGFFDPVIKYRTIAAGHIEVTEKQNTLAAMMTAWPIVQATPAASVFLSDLLILMFPEKAQSYIEALQQGGQEKDLIGRLWSLVNQLLKDPKTGEASKELDDPQVLDLYNQLAQQVSQVLQIEGVKDANITRAKSPAGAAQSKE